MIKLSFRQKILLLLIVCMCAAQTVTMLATLVTTETTILQSVTDDLEVTESIFDKLLEQRFYQLSESVQVLADDFGLKSAVTSEDMPTITSALENHAARAGASVAMFIGLQGKVKGNTLTSIDYLLEPSWIRLVLKLQQEDYLFSILSLEGLYYQIVSVPVTAPDKIGWLLMGFAVDDGLAEEIKHVSGLEISMYDGRSTDHNQFISTLDIRDEKKLITTLFGSQYLKETQQTTKQISLFEGEMFLTRIKPLSLSNNQLYVILQKSLEKELAPYEELENKLILFFLAALGCAILLGTYYASHLLSPIRDLVQATKQIGEGNYDVNIEIRSDDEIGDLATTLNTMQREIADREQRIIHQAYHDDLTNLPNRYLAQDRIKSAIHRSRRNNTPFTLVIMDLSRFKQINDSLGHHVGDVILKETARRLAQRLRKSDTAARLGGDDFLLILENTGLEQTRELLNRKLRPMLSAPVELEDMQIDLEFYYGIAEFPTHAENGTELLRRCEIALYDAKEHHEHTAVYEIGRDKNHRRQLAVVADLEEGLVADQFVLNYQPKVDLQTGAIEHAEALVRWMHPKYGFMPPDEFISVLESTGKIFQLTKWVLSRSAEQCRQWLDAGINLQISVNLSANDLLNKSLPTLLNQILGKHRLPSTQLVLEITESAVMNEPETAHKILTNLRQQGFRISIDDFGTGYSSLTQLKTLPVDELKIDKSFVLNLKPGSQDEKIVHSTIDLAHSLGLEVIAEGVETMTGASILHAYGCNKGQGYLFSKPLPAEEFTNWYKKINGVYQLNESEAA